MSISLEVLDLVDKTLHQIQGSPTFDGPGDDGCILHAAKTALEGSNEVGIVEMTFSRVQSLVERQVPGTSVVTKEVF